MSAHKTLGELLARHRDEIVADFVAEVRRSGIAPEGARTAVLVDHVPGFLDEVSAELAARGRASVPEAAEAALARGHGRSRWNAGYDLASVVREYEVLRRCILAKLRDEHGSVGLDDIEALAGALERGISEAVVGYMREREADLADAARRVDVADRARDDFLSVVSHELRTPLNAILGWAQILTGPTPPEPEILRRGLAVIYRNALLQTRIVDDILDAARLASGELAVARQPVSLELVVRAAVQSIQPEIDARGISLTLSLDPAPNVLGDAERLKQVVRNLLSNAAKFTPERGEVAVRLDRAEGIARVTVTDSGRGIAAADLPVVFDRFRQGDSSASRSTGGLGLGLAIARHLVQAHGGEIRVTSAGPGLGSTFTVELPIAT